MKRCQDAYPPISDYALISNCQCAALISRAGSIDWCCMPRFDSDSCFGRLLDWRKGGYCTVFPTANNVGMQRRYLPATMVLETRYRCTGAEVLVHDYFVMAEDPEARQGEQDWPRLIRLIRGISGSMEMDVHIAPRFDYGEISPHIIEHRRLYAAVGSNVGLGIESSAPLEILQHNKLAGKLAVSAGECVRLSISFRPPELFGDRGSLESFIAGTSGPDFEQTCAAWRTWASQVRMPFGDDEQTLRSAIVLKSLSYERTGAIVAAPTTSLPEWTGGQRNWDYRFSWVRDSVFTVRALNELGCQREADSFLAFVSRSSAGDADELQIMYAVDGKRRLTEVELKHLEGYRRSRPVRIGNAAAKQNQLDVYGELLELAWEWHAKGRHIQKRYWDFLVEAVDAACRKWDGPDFGIWEFRGGPQHYVHSKAMCWGALDHGIRLAQEQGLPAPLEDWQNARDRMRKAIEQDGYDEKRGIFVQAFGNHYLDSALLLLPRIGIVPYDDPRMVRTADAIRAELDSGGLLLRYSAPDGLPGGEGAFLPCTFWLVSCLAYQKRFGLAWDYYRRAAACANDLGLLSEEYDVKRGEMLGNFPQALTHVSQIMARLALG